MKREILFASLVLASPLLAQDSPDSYLGDWSGSLTLNGQTKNVGVYMIPLGGGKYDARFVGDFNRPVIYLHRLKGEIKNGQFKFIDDISFDVRRVIGTTDQGVVLEAALWSGALSGTAVKGTIAGKSSGTFELKQTQRVSPDLGKPPPAGALVLFDGKNLDRDTGWVLETLIKGNRGAQLEDLEALWPSDACPFVSRGSTCVRWDGRVSPCLPLLHGHVSYLEDRRRTIHPHALGSVLERSLLDIWASPEYAALRQRLEEFDFSPCTACNSCEKADDNGEDCLGNGLPACGGCLWAQGFIRCP